MSLAALEMVVGWLLTSYPHAALVPLSRGCASFRALHKVLRQKWRSTVGELLCLSGTSWWLGVGLCRLSVVVGARVETILESNPRVGLTLPNLPIGTGRFASRLVQVLSTPDTFWDATVARVEFQVRRDRLEVDTYELWVTFPGGHRGYVKLVVTTHYPDDPDPNVVEVFSSSDTD